MKKRFNKVLLFLMCLGLFMPNVYAAKISNTRIGGLDSVKVGKGITIPFYINLSGVSMTDVNSYGILAVGFEIIFDDDVFSITNVTSKGFSSNVYTEDGEYAIISAVNVLDTYNKCVDGYLYCGEYEVDVTFYAGDTDLESSVIKMGDIMVSGYQLKNGEFNTDEDTIDIEGSSNKSKIITITKTDEEVIEKPKSIVETSKPTIDTTKVIEEIATKKEEEIKTADKSTNTYLSDLTVKGYIVNFNKRTKEYEIEIEKGVNSLEVEAKLEDKKSTLEIIGADDLKKNNYKVLINVTSESGKKDTYTITAKEEIIKKHKKLSTIDFASKIKDIFNEYKLYIYISGGALLLFILIFIIINKVNDRKLGKKFDEF